MEGYWASDKKDRERGMLNSMVILSSAKPLAAFLDCIQGGYSLVWVGPRSFDSARLRSG